VTLGRLRARAGYLLRTEGVRGLMAGGFRSLRLLRRKVARYSRFQVFEWDTNRADVDSHRPAIDGLETVVLECDKDFEALSARGFETPVASPLFTPVWLSRGGVAFCAFVDGRLAHIQWVATAPSARGCCDGLPYRVDFAQRETCWGGAYTWPGFRGRGIFTHVCGLRLDYLRERGYRSCWNAVAVSNIRSLRAQAHWNPKLRMTARYVRFLRWKRWTEQPLSGPCPSPGRETRARRACANERSRQL
jgi:GNAT superfamily N-acetyltransferase